MFERKFPSTRLRRLRSSDFIRDLVAENKLTKDDLIQPIFIKDISGFEKIESMPGISRIGLDVLMDEIKEIYDLGIKSIAIFPVVDGSKKDEKGNESYNESNLVCTAIRDIKKNFPDMVIIADVALDPYTSHGHDGIYHDNYVLNDETIEILIKQSLSLAKAGADILAPSDMMDGRVGLIRNALENNNYKNTIILSYAAKFSSGFYGPFRNAVNSASNLGDNSKSTYQMDYANSDEALHEVALDIKEGADIVMVKPGMPYLDIIFRIKEVFKIPTFAYQVSGEYAMISQAISNGLLDKKVMLESLLSLKRAGADAILTYAAKEISKEL